MLALTWTPTASNVLVSVSLLRWGGEKLGEGAPADHGKLAGDEWTLGSPCDLGVPVSFTCLFLPHGSSGHSHLP